MSDKGAGISGSGHPPSTSLLVQSLGGGASDAGGESAHVYHNFLRVGRRLVREEDYERRTPLVQDRAGMGSIWGKQGVRRWSSSVCSRRASDDGGDRSSRAWRRA